MCGIASRRPPVLRLVLVHPRPELLRVLALPGGEREDLVGLVLAVAEQHVAVQVVAARHRGPLVADHRREASGIVVFLGCRGVLLPDGFHDRADDLWILDGRGQRVLRLAGHHVVGGVRGGLPAFLHRLVPSSQDRILRKRGIAFIDLEHQPQALGVVGDHQEIQRARQLGRNACGRDDFLAASEAIGLLRGKPVARHERVTRVRRMVVGVAEKRARRILAAGVRRVAARGGRGLRRVDDDRAFVRILDDLANLLPAGGRCDRQSDSQRKHVNLHPRVSLVNLVTRVPASIFTNRFSSTASVIAAHRPSSPVRPPASAGC